MRHVYHEKNVTSFFYIDANSKLQKFIKNVTHTNIQIIISKQLVVHKNTRDRF